MAFCLAVLGLFALQLGGGVVLGFGLAKQARTAEKEIQSYIETVEVSDMIRESRLLMASANDQSADSTKQLSLVGGSLPDEWKERKVNYITYDESSVYYSWTGGVLGGRGIRIEDKDGRISVIAQIKPDEAPVVLHPPKEGHIQSR